MGELGEDRELETVCECVVGSVWSGETAHAGEFLQRSQNQCDLIWSALCKKKDPITKLGAWVELTLYVLAVQQALNQSPSARDGAARLANPRTATPQQVTNKDE